METTLLLLFNQIWAKMRIGVGKRDSKVDIPEFHDGLQVEGCLDWINDVEEILEFKEILET